MGISFLAVAINTSFYDDDGTLIGIIGVPSHSRPYQEAKAARAYDMAAMRFRGRDTVSIKLRGCRQESVVVLVFLL